MSISGLSALKELVNKKIRLEYYSRGKFRQGGGDGIAIIFLSFRLYRPFPFFVCLTVCQYSKNKSTQKCLCRYINFFICLLMSGCLSLFGFCSLPRLHCQKNRPKTFSHNLLNTNTFVHLKKSTMKRHTCNDDV